MIVRLVKISATLIALAMAAFLCWRFYLEFERHPWTRDGQVRAYVVGIAARVDGPMVKVFVEDNQWVEEGDRLFQIDPTDYEKEANRAEAAVEKAKTVAANLSLEVERRRGLVKENLISLEEFQSLEADYVEAVADIALAEADLELARLDLSYTEVRAPVSGYITNLQVTKGAYVVTGQSLMALVDASSFWISAYFKETDLQAIKPGERVRIIMMGDFFEPFEGVVQSVSWGIYRVDGSVNAETQLPVVQPTVDWVRLAQRFPVRIKPLELPEGMQLRVGQTVSVLVNPIGQDPAPAPEAEAAPPPREPGFPKTITDGRGAQVVIEGQPQRIVSLAPSTTQWLRELDAPDRLVGVTPHCEVGEDAEGAARLAVHPSPSFEKILDLNPDLIVAADIADPKDVARLRELGQTVLVLNNDRFDGVLRDGQTLGEAIGASGQARETIAELEADRAAVAASIANREASEQVLLALGTKLDYVAGPGSYADNLLQLAGAENAAAEAKSMWPKLSREAVIGADPGVIIVTHALAAGTENARAEVLAALRDDPVWRHLSAVKAGRVGVVDSTLMNVPGPRIGEALRSLHAAIEAAASGEPD